MKKTASHEKVQTDLAKRMVEERTRLGLTQAALAEASALSRLSVVNYETGATVPSGEALIALDAVGIDIRYVLVGKTSSDMFAARKLFAKAFAEVSRQARANSESLTDAKRLDLAWRFYDALLNI
jgi:transcriptional regulator with XRE-family HTH domain